MDTSKPGTELLADLADRIATHLANRGWDGDQSHDIGESIAMEIAGEWGGQLLYIPKGKFVLLAKRDREIWAAFDGQNIKDLVRQFKVTEQHIYRIIKAMRKADADARHGDLFSASQPSDATL
jgi:Mor family transcriptional regulator